MLCHWMRSVPRWDRLLRRSPPHSPPPAPKKTSRVFQPKSRKSSKKQTLKYVIDCYIPVEDRVLDPASFEKFLHDRIKVNGKAGQLGDVITIAREKVGRFSRVHSALRRYIRFSAVHACVRTPYASLPCCPNGHWRTTFPAVAVFSCVALVHKCEPPKVQINVVEVSSQQ